MVAAACACEWRVWCWWWFRQLRNKHVSIQMHTEHAKDSFGPVTSGTRRPGDCANPDPP